MKLAHTHLPGVTLIDPDVFGDSRGWFLETWNAARYGGAGLAAGFVQDNLSLSRRGILRGLHFQNPNAQGKLMTVLTGEVFDVVVDLRRGSATFGQWDAFPLSGETKRQVFVPPGFAHGFQVVSDSALFSYKCTTCYSPKDEHTLRWDDPALAIPWPIKDPILSSKDAAAPRLSEIPAEQIFA